MGCNLLLSLFILMLKSSPISQEALQPAPVSFGHVLIILRALP